MKLTKSKLKEIIKEEISKENPINEGPAYEYAKYFRNIEKAQKLMDRSVGDLQKVLKKGGHTHQHQQLQYFYAMLVSGGKKSFDKLIQQIHDKLA